MGEISARRLKGRREAGHMKRLNIFVAFGLILGYVLYTCLDLNRPDDFTLAPSLTALVSFVLIALVINTLLTRILFPQQKVESWGSLAPFGICFLFSVSCAMVWYRVFWLPSSYIIYGGDHHKFLDQALQFLESQSEGIIPGAHLIWMNSAGHSMIMAALFSIFGQSTYYVIAFQCLLFLWSALCLHCLSKSDNALELDGRVSERIRAGWVVAAYQILPLTVNWAGVITKESSVLFGVAACLVGYSRLRPGSMTGGLGLFSVGFVVALLSRPPLSIGILIVILITSILTRSMKRGFFPALVFVIIGTCMVGFAAQKGLLGTGEGSGLFLESVSSQVEKGPTDFAANQFLGSLASPTGTFSRLFTIPVLGSMSWLIPFPIYPEDADALLNVSWGLGNIVALGLFFACLSVLWRRMSLAFRGKTSVITCLMVAAAVTFFLANGASVAPNPRYRFAFDWVIMFFLVRVPTLRRNLFTGLLLSLAVVTTAHVAYFVLRR
jgi:hypothetical protein